MAVARHMSGDTVLVAFLASGPADDGAVRVSLSQYQGLPDVRTFVFNDSGGRGRPGGLSLAVVETPTVAVVDGKGQVNSRWVGLVDTGMMRQAIVDAQAGLLTRARHRPTAGARGPVDPGGQRGVGSPGMAADDRSQRREAVPVRAGLPETCTNGSGSPPMPATRPSARRPSRSG